MSAPPPSPDLTPAGPDEGATSFDRAVAHHRAGRLAEAVDLYRSFLATAPDHVAGHANLAVALRALGRRDDALAVLDRLVAIAPDRARSYWTRGGVLNDMGRLEDALADFERAVAIDPADAQVQHSRAFVLQALQRSGEALAGYDRAVALAPDNADIRINRGNALFKQGRPADALADYRRALDLRPDDAAAHYNHARGLEAVGRFDEALAGYDLALALNPTLEVVFWERARCRLKVGRFAEGWEDYEHRWRLDAFRQSSAGLVTPDLQARLDPRLSIGALAGRRVLAVAEQGLGDIVMFASIIPDLARDAATVKLLCEPRLQRLFRHSFPGVEVVSSTAEHAEVDHVVAIGGLGRLYRNRRAAFPGTPYLSANPDIRARWAARLGARTTPLRVGLSWRGGIAATGRTTRSMALADLSPILDLPQCEFVSLQYGDVAAELEAANRGRARPIRLFPAAEMDDFEDLAGLVEALDVVVSVQTAVVHLAGALGQRTLAMIPHNPEWRYGATGPSMPWYGSVELTRQDAPGAWDPVIARVAERLQALAAPNGPPR